MVAPHYVFLQLLLATLLSKLILHLLHLVLSTSSCSFSFTFSPLLTLAASLRSFSLQHLTPLPATSLCISSLQLLFAAPLCSSSLQLLFAAPLCSSSFAASPLPSRFPYSCNFLQLLLAASYNFSFQLPFATPPGKLILHLFLHLILSTSPYYPFFPHILILLTVLFSHCIVPVLSYSNHKV